MTPKDRRGTVAAVAGGEEGGVSAEQSAEIAVGDRLDSVYGAEHRGTVVEVGAFADGTPTYFVKRDSDEFIWIGWADTVERVTPSESRESSDG